MAEISVRRLLFRWLLAPSIVVLAIAAAAGYRVTLHSATVAYDGALLDGALSLAQLLRVSGESGALSLSRSADILLRTDKYDRIYYSVRNAEGRLIVGDELLLPPPDSFSSGGCSTTAASARSACAWPPWRSRCPARVSSSRSRKPRQAAQAGRGNANGIGGERGTFMAAVIGLVWLGIGRGLAPLQRLRQEIEARSHRDAAPGRGRPGAGGGAAGGARAQQSPAPARSHAARAAAVRRQCRSPAAHAARRAAHAGGVPGCNSGSRRNGRGCSSR